MSTVHRWLADNPVWVAFAFLSACIALARLLVGNADLSPLNIGIALAATAGGCFLARLVTATYYRPTDPEAHLVESRRMARASVSLAKAALAEKRPTLRRHGFPSAKSPN